MLRTFSLSIALRIMRLVLSLIIASLLGRYLGRAGFGQLSVAMASIGILICIGELGLARYTVRELMLSAAGEAATLGTTIGMRLRIAALLFTGLVIYLLIVQPTGSTLLLLYGLHLLTNPCTELFAWFEAHSRIQNLALAQFTAFLISALCIFIGVWQQLPLWYFAIPYAIEGWVWFILAFILFRRYGGTISWGSYTFAKARELFSRSWFELASQLSLFLLFRLDAIMVQSLRGQGEAGLYAASVRISEVVYFIPAIFSTLCLPKLIELRKTDSTAYEQRVTDYFSASFLIALAAASALALGSPIVQMLFGSDFKGSADILIIHAWAFIPYAIGTARTQYLTVEDKLWVNLPSIALALVINIILNLLWIPTHGAIGAAWATLIAYTIAWLVSSFFIPSSTVNLRALLLRSCHQLPSFTLRSLRHLRPAR